ncbi:hypothetical protein QR98_0005990 [Sarcoptes scabiei]|uniref:Uncharacterized protein n=1 Tax=Sarcoptes scabiei TaxID=52283 RepID=A0A131ZUE1_SARSC|nr:hypothetical protein QR98_0005990 [Sarcoptes scabiei]
MNNLLKQSGQKKSIDTSSSLISTQITEASDSFQMQSEANEESGEKSIDNPDYLMEDETNPDDNNNGMVQTNFSTNPTYHEKILSIIKSFEPYFIYDE